MEPVLELRNATLVRGRTRVFEDLSLTVAPREHTAVLGPNGAGKSSFIRMLTLDDRPRATENGAPPLRLFGRSHWDLSELRARLGVVTGDLDAGFGLGTSGGRVRGLDVVLSGLLGSHGVFSHHEVTDAMRDRAFEGRLVQHRGDDERAKRRLGGDGGLGLAAQAGPDRVEPVEAGCEIASFHGGAP